MVAIKFLFPSGESAMRKRVVINYPKSPHQHPTVLVGARIAINTLAWSFNTKGYADFIVNWGEVNL